ncbi:uncharacterized protein E0L32_007848 [Thyridium curvatum]|uniref:U three protein 23 n=1 Tax=Thyridium curvatum TaxID=1093900 RepID=A0A507B2B2_9PEZI|nr:uncharacterized protein E0L32_007848 [Thyridium curvatum]TPX11429.1 hypothetical protein E0L32_007848 [Thyridium curvatum]
MRGKRSKQYRRLLKTLEIRFGFREPYQVLVDSDMVRDTARFKMDLVPALERTLHGQVKPMITQCSMRHLYAAGREDRSLEAVIDRAKTFERRRCGHRPEDFPEPLPELECLRSVVDGKKSGENRHRYVVASQDVEVRRALRGVKACPLIYVSRSVMIMEPLSEGTVRAGEREERAKFRAEIKKVGGGGKRKRDDGDGDDNEEEEDGDDDDEEKKEEEKKPKKKKARGPKGPNPLAVKKKKPQAQQQQQQQQQQGERKKAAQSGEKAEGGDQPAKKKRKRKHKSGAGAVAGDAAEQSAAQPEAPAAVAAEA